MASKKGTKQSLGQALEYDALKHDAHIPESLRDPVLVFASEPASVGPIPTVFVCIVDEDYTEDMWKRHSNRLANLFCMNITDALQIKV